MTYAVVVNDFCNDSDPPRAGPRFQKYHYGKAIRYHELKTVKSRHTSADFHETFEVGFLRQKRLSAPLHTFYTGHKRRILMQERQKTISSNSSLRGTTSNRKSIHPSNAQNFFDFSCRWMVLVAHTEYNRGVDTHRHRISF